MECGAGGGTTGEMSGGGVLSTAQHELALGMRIELAVEWPILLEGSIPLQLCLSGTIVRVRGHQAAFEIKRHLFRTTKRRGTSEFWPFTSREGLPLTKCQLEVVQLVAQGYKNKEIAEQTSTSGQTVKSHLHNIYKKLGASDRLELALYAIHKGVHSIRKSSAAAVFVASIKRDQPPPIALEDM